MELEKEGVVIIPRFNIQLQKTRVYEFVNSINSYLISRKGILEGTDPLFKVSPRYFSTRFSELNDIMGLGYVDEYRRFRSHMVRKFHASNLKLGETELSEEIVNKLQGRVKPCRSGKTKRTSKNVNKLQGRVKPVVNQSYFFERDEDYKGKIHTSYAKYFD